MEGPRRAQPSAVTGLPARRPWVSILLGVGAAVWANARVGVGTITDVAEAADRSGRWPQDDVPELSKPVRNSPVGQIAYEVIGAPGVWGYVILRAVAAVLTVRLLAWRLVRVSPTGSGPLGVRLALPPR